MIKISFLFLSEQLFKDDSLSDDSLPEIPPKTDRNSKSNDNSKTDENSKTDDNSKPNDNQAEVVIRISTTGSSHSEQKPCLRACNFMWR